MSDAMRFVYISNFSSIPSISAPSGVDENNLPIGIQFMAEWYGDGRLFEAAKWMEERTEKLWGCVTTPSPQKIDWERTLPASASHVKVSGCDIDGISRGKLILRNKLTKSSDQEFGFCNVIFGWDSHDQVYGPEVPVDDGGYPDIIAKVDLSTLRLIPWEQNNPLVLVDFIDPKTRAPVPQCPRSLLKGIVQRGKDLGLRANVGIEYEFFNFKKIPSTLAEKQGVKLTPLTSGMFGYSLTCTHQNKDYFLEVLETCNKMNIQLEGYHTETGPGVYEVAIQYNDPVSLADQAHLFKTTAKCVGLTHGVMPTFMAKPHNNLPGCSGHIHVSLSPLGEQRNLFAKALVLSNDKWNVPLQEGEQAVSEHVTSCLRSFLAGVLKGLPSMMAIFAPTINSYKRLVENYWAPITVSYGVENRTTAIRLITPPTCPPSATRLEIRVPGADANPYLAVAAILACGFEGIKQNMKLELAPSDNDKGNGTTQRRRLARSLKDAIAEMEAEDSFARVVLGDAFVSHFVGTRKHEWRIWERAVTNWELNRYMETV